MISLMIFIKDWIVLLRDIKKLSKKDMKLKSKPWLTPAIINLINNRNKLYRRTKRQPKNENISIKEVKKDLL